MAQTAKTATATKRPPRTLAGAVSPTDDPAHAQILGEYETAIRLMQEGKFEKARAAFEKLLAAGAGNLSDRIRMYISASTAQLSRAKASFTSHEEHYDYAVSLLNDGHYEDAREQFQEILKQKADADYAFYGLAVLASMTGDSHTCLEHL